MDWLVLERSEVRVRPRVGEGSALGLLVHPRVDSESLALPRRNLAVPRWAFLLPRLPRERVGLAVRCAAGALLRRLPASSGKRLHYGRSRLRADDLRPGHSGDLVGLDPGHALHGLPRVQARLARRRTGVALLGAVPAVAAPVQAHHVLLLRAPPAAIHRDRHRGFFFLSAATTECVGYAAHGRHVGRWRLRAHRRRDVLLLLADPECAHSAVHQRLATPHVVPQLGRGQRLLRLAAPLSPFGGTLPKPMKKRRLTLRGRRARRRAVIVAAETFWFQPSEPSECCPDADSAPVRG